MHIELVFREIAHGENRYLYEMHYLDMRFTISVHPDYWGNKVFAGYRQDDLSYFELNYKSNSFPLQLGKKYTPKDRAHLEMENICAYIKDLYGYEKVTYRVEDYFNNLLESWLES